MNSIAFAGTLGNLLSAPWAIHPVALNELIGIYERHMRGEAANVAAIEARIGKPLQNTPQQGYEMLPGGVAAVRISGVIAPKMNMLIAVSGGASAQLAARDIGAAAADPAVRSIVLAIDSPGGSVLGVPELAQGVQEAAARKTVVAHSDGTLCSAAYWIASATNAIYVSGPTVQAGSIGVVSTHYENSRAQAAAGTKTTEIVAGKYKRIASAHEPLTKEGRASIQAEVDYIYALFVDAVAQNRGVSNATVLDKMADGRVFIGQQAIDAGLVDGISSFDALVADLATNPLRYVQRRRPPATTAASSPRSTPKGISTMQTTQTTASPPLTKAAMAKRASALAAEEGISFLDAFRKSGFDVAYVSRPPEALSAAAPSAAAAEARRKEQGQQVAEAKRYALEHRVGFLDAMKALGFAS